MGEVTGGQSWSPEGLGMGRGCQERRTNGDQPGVNQGARL